MKDIDALVEKSALRLMGLEWDPGMLLEEDGYVFRRMSLVACMPMSPVRCSFVRDNVGKWFLCDPNMIRYVLGEYKDSMPYRINEKKVVDVMENLYRESEGYFCRADVVLAYFPGDINMSVAECRFRSTDN